MGQSMSMHVLGERPTEKKAVMHICPNKANCDRSRTARRKKTDSRGPRTDRQDMARQKATRGQGRRRSPCRSKEGKEGKNVTPEQNTGPRLWYRPAGTLSAGCYCCQLLISFHSHRRMSREQAAVSAGPRSVRRTAGREETHEREGARALVEEPSFFFLLLL